MIYLKQLKIFSYYRKFLRFLADLLCENLSLESVFKEIIITQLLLKIKTYRKKTKKKTKKKKKNNIIIHPTNCRTTRYTKECSVCFLTKVSIFVQNYFVF